MRWAFIDYENIGGLSKIDLSIYSRIIFFLGAKQPKIDFGDKKYDFPLDMVLIQLKAIQSNNLDFHLSYYLGKYDNEAAENVLFEVISNDNGFTPLIAHIKANGRACKQIKSTSATTPKSKLINSLTSKPKEKRPKKITSLKNHIATHMRIQGNEVAIQNLLNQLVNEEIIAVAGESIEYKY
jgi:PIN domain